MCFCYFLLWGEDLNWYSRWLGTRCGIVFQPNYCLVKRQSSRDRKNLALGSHSSPSCFSPSLFFLEPFVTCTFYVLAHLFQNASWWFVKLILKHWGLYEDCGHYIFQGGVEQTYSPPDAELYKKFQESHISLHPHDIYSCGRLSLKKRLLPAILIQIQLTFFQS